MDEKSVKSATEYLTNALGPVAFLIVVYVLVSNNDPTTLFFWHPILMSLSFLVFMAQGILLLIGDTSLTGWILGLVVAQPNRAKKVQVHSILQLLAVLFYLGGFLLIFKNKEDKNSNHFTTWHGLFGVVTIVVGMFSNMLLGLILFFDAKNVVERFSLKLLQIKKWHRSSSWVTLILGLGTIGSSLWSNFAVTNFSYIMSCTILVCCVLLVGLLSWITFRWSVKAVQKQFCATSKESSPAPDGSV